MKLAATLLLVGCRGTWVPPVVDGTYDVTTATLATDSAGVKADAVFFDDTGGTYNQLGFGIWELTSEMHLPSPAIALDLQLEIADGDVTFVNGEARSGKIPFDVRNNDVVASDGAVALAIQFADADPIELALTDATVVLEPTTLAGAFGGRVSVADLNDKLIPTVVPLLNGVIARDCPLPQTPDCGCPADSAGHEAVVLFANGSCAITNAGFAMTPLLQSIITPDDPAGLSIGMAVTTERQ